MVKRGFRAVYAPRAVALEKMTTDLSDEFRRKVRMFGHCWLLVLHGRMFGLRALGPLYWVEMISHRLLRYASGILHLALLATSIVLAFSAGGVYAVVLGLHVVFALCVLASIALRGRVRVLALARVLLPDHAGDAARARRRRARRARRVGTRGGHAMNAEGERVKRAIDVVGAAAGLAAGRSDPRARGLRDQARGRRARCSSGRCGSARGEQPFEVLKLRTMTVDAEKIRSDGVVEEGDPRITRIGALLRRTAVDELPQLWNVLRGEMSLVGPRPVPLPHLERYDERQRRRLEVRPGLTGWAQIHGRASLPWPERLELDVWYVEHRSLRARRAASSRAPPACSCAATSSTAGRPEDGGERRSPS